MSPLLSFFSFSSLPYDSLQGNPYIRKIMKFCGHLADILVCITHANSLYEGMKLRHLWKAGYFPILRYNSRAVRDGENSFRTKDFFFLIRSYHVVENLSLTMQNGEIARWGQSHFLEVNLPSEKRLGDTYSLSSFIQVILYKMIDRVFAEMGEDTKKLIEREMFGSKGKIFRRTSTTTL